MYKIGIVILHYMVLEETIKCVDSIKQHLDYANYSIVIVDNASPNQSGEKLSKIYKEDAFITVICNKENLGFSKGNNVGYKFAKYELNCDFIIVSNNDIEFKSNNIGNILIEDFRQSNYAVLGPSIQPAEIESTNINPYHKIELSTFQMRNTLLRMKFDLKLAKILSYVKLNNFYFMVRGIPGKILNYRQKELIKYEQEKIVYNTGLHGCIWIFSPLYVQKFDGLLETTFMYYEEWILYDQMKIHNMLMMYDPSIKVYHAEKISTKQVNKKQSISFRIRYDRELESIDCVLKYINN